MSGRTFDPTLEAEGPRPSGRRSASFDNGSSAGEIYLARKRALERAAEDALRDAAWAVRRREARGQESGEDAVTLALSLRRHGVDEEVWEREVRRAAADRAEGTAYLARKREERLRRQTSVATDAGVVQARTTPPDLTVPTDALNVQRRDPTSSTPTGDDRRVGGNLVPSVLPGHGRTEGEERTDPVAPAPPLSTAESVLPPHVAHTIGSDTHGIPTADVQHREVETHDAAPRTGTAHHAPRADDDLRRATPLPQSKPSGLAPLVIPSTSRQLDILRARGDGVPLAPGILRHMEANMRVPLGDMRIHNDPDAWTLCQRLGAQAFADGTDIYFQKGAYQPGTPQGRNLLGRQLQRAVAWRTTQEAQARQETLHSAEVRTMESDGSSLSDARFPDASTLGATVEVARTLYPPSPSLISGHAPFIHSPASDAETFVGAHDTGRSLIVNIAQFLYVHSDAGIDVHAAPQPWKVDHHGKRTSNKIGHYPLCKKLFSDQRIEGHSGNDVWYRVMLPDGRYGYVVGFLLSTFPADSAATLVHISERGEGALKVANQHYSVATDLASLNDAQNRDLRFYVNVLAYINPRAIRNPDPTSTDPENWKNTTLYRNSYIWVPSKEYADGFKGRLSSGSITGGTWALTAATLKDAARLAGEQLTYLEGGIAFDAGMLFGGATAIIDTLKGMGDSVRLVLDLIRSLFVGHLVGQAADIWKALTHLRDVVATGVANFTQQWNDPDFIKRWFFRGQVVGGAIVTIALTIFSGGILAAVKGVPMVARVLEVLGGLKVTGALRAAFEAAKMTTVGQKVWYAAHYPVLLNALGSRTLGRLLHRERIPLRGVQTLVDEIGHRAVKTLVRKGMSGKDIASLIDKLGPASVRKLVANDIQPADMIFLADKLDSKLVTHLLPNLTQTGMAEVRATFTRLGSAYAREFLEHLTPEQAADLGHTFSQDRVKGLLRAGLSIKNVSDLTMTIGPSAMEDLLRIGLQPEEIKSLVDDFVAAMGRAKVAHIASRYGGKAMKHYGHDFFRDYKGVTRGTGDNTTMGHIIDGGGTNTPKSPSDLLDRINGCHDRGNFLRFLRAKRGKIVSRMVRGDFTAYEYKISGNTKTLRKTVINDLASNPAKWERIGTEAADDAIRRLSLPRAGGLFLGYAKDRLELDMSYNVGQVRRHAIGSFYPILSP